MLNRITHAFSSESYGRSFRAWAQVSEQLTLGYLWSSNKKNDRAWVWAFFTRVGLKDKSADGLLSVTSAAAAGRLQSLLRCTCIHVIQVNRRRQVATSDSTTGISTCDRGDGKSSPVSQYTPLNADLVDLSTVHHCKQHSLSIILQRSVVSRRSDLYGSALSRQRLISRRPYRFSGYLSDRWITQCDVTVLTVYPTFTTWS